VSLVLCLALPALAGADVGTGTDPAATSAVQADTEEVLQAGYDQGGSDPDTDGDGVPDATDGCPEVAASTPSGCFDGDGDGVPDKDDTCPTVSGAQSSGCPPDGDADGVDDAADACPAVAAQTADGCPPDRDNDGVRDAADACPGVGAPTANGCPPDRDKDGEPDATDACPAQPAATANGCPAPAPKPACYGMGGLKLRQCRRLTACDKLGVKKKRECRTRATALNRCDGLRNPAKSRCFADERQREGSAHALRWAQAQNGTKELPAGSNRGPEISRWQRSFASWLVGQPWCGVFIGVALRDYGGVRGLTARVAAVAYIEDDARAGRNGFRSWHSARAGKPGDAVVLFGRGVHAELIVARHSWGYETIGGNTSPEGRPGGANGGQVARRRRPFSVVRGCARPNY